MLSDKIGSHVLDLVVSTPHATSLSKPRGKKLVKNLCKFVTVLVQKDTTYSLITLISPLITCCEVI